MCYKVDCIIFYEFVAINILTIIITPFTSKNMFQANILLLIRNKIYIYIGLINILFIPPDEEQCI